MMEHKKVTGFLIGERFVEGVGTALKERYKCVEHKDVFVVWVDKNECVVLLRYGAIVCWHVGYENLKFFKDFLRPFTVDAYQKELVEEFDYTLGSEYKISEDTIYFDNESVDVKIALSHAIAQTLKIELFEKQIAQTIEESSAIPKQLAATGKIGLNKKDISKKIGELFLVKSRVNLHYDLLDTPEYFWEYPEYEGYYERMTKYLDLDARVAVLNKKVEVIQEILDMLSDEQKHKYSSFLEWIIIILIGVEIVMSLFEHFVL